MFSTIIKEQHGLTKSEALDLNTPKVTVEKSAENGSCDQSECPLCDEKFASNSDSYSGELLLKVHLIEKHAGKPEKVNIMRLH